MRFLDFKQYVLPPASKSSRHLWILSRGLNSGNAPLIDATLSALELGGEEAFLDVGFGGGRAIREASTRTRGRLYGADFSADMVVRGNRALADLCGAGRLSLFTADVVDLPLRDRLVDVIATTNTIYFWPDLPAALAELHRLLAPGGRVGLGYTGRHKMERFDTVTRHGFRTFLPEELEQPLWAAGFEAVETLPLSGAALSGDFVTRAMRA